MSATSGTNKAPDPDIGRWVAGMIQRVEFWDSSPGWKPAVALCPVGHDLAVWTDRETFTVAAIQASVAIHLDHTISLRVLAEDLAAAAGSSLGWAQQTVAMLVAELYLLDAIDGVDLGERPPVLGPDAATTIEVQAPNGDRTSNAQVVTEVGPDGTEVITEFLPNGSRRVTTTLNLSGPHAHGAGSASETLSGNRSPAELVPADSCLGSKLRIGDSAPLVSFQCRDGRIRSVRCQDSAVAAALRSMAGPALVTSRDRGPIIAFVVTPHEGCGPVRIYDSVGRRRGRPRSIGDAVEVVDQVVGEHTDEATKVTKDGKIPIEGRLIHRDGRAILMPTGILSTARTERRLEAAGWSVTWGRPGLAADGCLVSPSELGTGTTIPPTHVTVVIASPAEMRQGELIHLLHGGATIEPGHRQPILERLCRFAQSVSVADLERALPSLTTQPDLMH